LLDALDSLEAADAIAVNLPPGVSWRSPDARHESQKVLPQGLLDMAVEAAGKSSTGIIGFWGEGVKVMVSPPFPVGPGAVVTPGLDTGPLRQAVQKDYLVGVVLLRLGRYSMGVFKGYEALATKSGSRLVHGRHRAGGSSSMRFARRREKQIFEILKEACEEVTRKFGPFERQLEYVLLGGERQTLLEFKKQCRFIQRMEPRILGRVLPVNEPSHEALMRIPRELYRSQVWVRELPEGVEVFGHRPGVG
jgi:hypothetical protein